MKGLLGHNRKLTESKRYDRMVRRLIRHYPDLWPAAVVHRQARWQDMPADQFDWAIGKSIERLKKATEQRMGR
jgi:hypothetical protein